MSEKKAIKIIKKHERGRKQEPVAEENTPAQTAREMVQTVTNWINELQQKRHAETTQAIKEISLNRPAATITFWQLPGPVQQPRLAILPDPTLDSR